MRRFAIIFILVISISACSPGKVFGPTFTLRPTTTPTPSNTPTPTQTPTSAPTSTPTPTPTAELPVSLGMPLPDVREPIGVDNATQLKMLANYERYDLSRSLVKLTSDGKYYFVVADGGVVSQGGIDVYDAQTMSIVKHYPIFQRKFITYTIHDYKYNPYDLQLSADGRRFMIRTRNTTLSVYNFDGQEIYNFSFPDIIYNDIISDEGGATLSPDGKYLVIDICSACNRAYWENSGLMSFKVIDLDSGEVVFEKWKSSSGEARGYNPQYSPDGKYLVTRVGSQAIIWNTEDWTQITSINVDTNPFGMNFSPDSTILAISSINKVNVWRWEDQQKLLEITWCGDRNNPTQATISPNNLYIAVLNCGYLGIWNINDDNQTYQNDITINSISGVSLNNDGSFFTYEPIPKPGVIYAPWNIWQANQIFIYSDSQNSLNFVSHSNGGSATRPACFIPIGSAREAPKCEESGWVWDGTKIIYIPRIFLGSDGQFYSGNFDSIKKAYELYQGMSGSGIPIFSFQGDKYYGGVAAHGVDMAHQLLLYSDFDYANHKPIIYIMDMTNGQNIQEWYDFGFAFNQISYSPDGKMIVFFVQNLVGTRMIVYDLENRRTAYWAYKRAYNEYGAAFSPDGKYLAHYLYQPGDEQPDFFYILEIDNPTHLKRYQFTQIPEQWPTTISWSPTGSILAIGFSKGIVRLFDAQNGSMIHEWNANNINITGLAFSADGKYLASASRDGTIRIWGIWP